MSQYVDDVPEYSDQKDNSGLAALSHILGLMFGLVGPIIIYAIADDDFVRKNAAKAFSWQVFLLLYFFLSFFMSFFFIGLLIFPLLILLNVVFSIVGAVKASKGKVWKYPGTMNILEKTEEKTNSTAQGRSQRGRRRRRSETASEDLTEDKLKQMYIDGEISEEEFDRKLDKIQKKDQLERDYN